MLVALSLRNLSIMLEIYTHMTIKFLLIKNQMNTLLTVLVIVISP